MMASHRRPAQAAAPLLLMLFVTCLCSLVAPMHAANAAEWKSATIYQLLTDRFAPSSAANACTDLSSYCGGTFNSITSKLSYLQQLGVDAVWISPVVENTPGGYHGYWAKNLNNVNPNFGTKDDLKKLVKAFHNSSMKVMVDVVANHMGPVGFDYSQLVPFNSPDHYHCCGCNDCSQSCNIPDDAFNSIDPNQRKLVLNCRLAGLPDLNQANSYVRQQLKDWVQNLVRTYQFDGLRIDTVPEVDPGFWKEFVQASGVFATGEVFSANQQLVGPYQSSVGSVLNYPMYFAMRRSFGAYSWPPESMWVISNTRKDIQKNFQDPTVLGNFIDNHDNPRFLNQQRDWHLYFNALTYVLMSEGIPIIYYGSEAAFSGGADPACREALWNGGFKTDHYIFRFLQSVIQYRKKYKVWKYPHQEVFVSDNCYVFTRGQVLVALTNVGSNQDNVTCSFGLPASWGGWPSVLPTPAAAQVDTKVTVTFRYGAPALFVAAPGANGTRTIESMEIPTSAVAGGRRVVRPPVATPHTQTDGAVVEE